MAIKPLDHYSITNIKPSVYEEESMTALELVGRIGQRLNEAIAVYNELEANTDEKLAAFNEFIKIMNEVTMPEKVKNEVDLHIARGDFDRAISIYLGDLESRVDNLLNTIPEGSTTMDAEIIDARHGGNGVSYPGLGQAIRDQYIDLSVSGKDKRSFTAERYGYRFNHNLISLWEQGWLNSETGEPGNTGSDYQMFIRTRDFIPSNIERVISPKLRLEIFVYKKGSAQFEYKLDHRHADYHFNHASYLYKIHATGYDENINNYHSTKALVVEDNAEDIYFLSGAVAEIPDTVSASASDLGYKRDINYRSLWSQGYIYGSNGSYGIDPRGYDYWLYTRSGNLPESVEAVAVKTGFKARLFRYKEQEFVDFVDVSTNPVKLNHAVYGYRIDVTKTTNVNGDRHDVCDMWSNVLLLSGTEKSPFDKDVYFPNFVTTGYLHEIEVEHFDATGLSTAEDIIHELCNGYGWHQEIIGEDADLNEIYAYRRKDDGMTVEGSVKLNKPKIIIIGGQHGFEQGNVHGLFAFMKWLGTCDHSNPSLASFLVANYEFVIVPIANPFGYDNQTYKNANGVNLNRNYDYKWVHDDDTESDQYGGEAPFDQPETRAIRDLILNEENVCLVIDSHSMGSGNVNTSRQLNWITAPGETDEYYKRLANVAYSHLNYQNTYYTSLNDWFQTGYYQGFDGTVTTTPSLDNWCVYKNKIMSLTFEGHNGYNEENHCSRDVINRNANMILNFIACFCAEYSRR